MHHVAAAKYKTKKQHSRCVISMSHVLAHTKIPLVWPPTTHNVVLMMGMFAGLWVAYIVIKLFTRWVFILCRGATERVLGLLSRRASDVLNIVKSQAGTAWNATCLHLGAGRDAVTTSVQVAKRNLKIGWTITKKILTIVGYFYYCIVPTWNSPVYYVVFLLIALLLAVSMFPTHPLAVFSERTLRGLLLLYFTSWRVWRFVNAMRWIDATRRGAQFATWVASGMGTVSRWCFVSVIA